MDDVVDVAVVGAGPAGTSAVPQIRPAARVVLRDAAAFPETRHVVTGSPHACSVCSMP